MLFNISFAYSEFYEINIKGCQIGNKFTPGKKYFIFNDSNYQSKNSFYLKIFDAKSSNEINNEIVNFLSSKGINDFQITKISQPFNFYYSNQFQKKNNYINKIFKISFQSSYSAYEISKVLIDNQNFEYVLPESFPKLTEYNINDPKYAEQWHLEAMKMKQVWEIAKADTSVIIGIVDSGVHLTHEDLQSAIFRNYNEIPNDKKDNDNNGFVDDYQGWDFIGNITLKDALNENYKPDSDVTPAISNTHGSHVSGIAAASTNNAKGVSSVGFGARILPVKVASDDISPSTGVDRVMRGYEGILYAAKMGADIINCSWISEFHNPLAQDIINQVTEDGALVVAAAGNSAINNMDFPIIPANLENVISVGAVNQYYNTASFTDFGLNVDIFAPGVNIFSTLEPNNYGNKNGTSMAAPVIAGFAAILKSIHRDWTPKQIYHQIRGNTLDITEIDPIQKPYYWGVINPPDAVKYNYSQGLTKPGISNEQILFDNSDKTTVQNEFSNLQIVMKNYLGRANNIKYSLISQTNYSVISDVIYIKTALNSNESDTIFLKVKLNENTPYYEGNFIILIKIEADNYLNYDYAVIPYKLETTSKFITAQYFDEYTSYDWTKAHSPEKFSFWAIGLDNNRNRGVVFSFGQIGTLPYTSKIPTAIFGFNKNKAFLAERSTNISESSDLSVTYNGGYNFELIDKPLPQINEIFFFDENKGIILGSSNAGYYGIRLTSDGGQTWKTNPLIQGDDDIINSAYFSKTGLIAAVSSLNKILISDDFGYSWTVRTSGLSDTILSISAINKDSLMILTNDKNENYFTYFSVDGAKSFKQNPYSFNSANRIPLNLYKPENSGAIYTHCQKGEILMTLDLGQNWHHVLTKQYNFGPLQTFAGFDDNCGVRLWQLGLDLAYTDIEKIPTEPKPLINIAGKSNHDFDTININNSKKIQIFIQNEGNATVGIQEQLFLNQTEANFNITKKFKKSVLSCELIDAELSFNPKTKGIKYDTLIIINNSLNDTLKFNLIGFAVDPAGVNTTSVSNVLISPNPATDFITIQTQPSEGLNPSVGSFVEIYDMLGVKVISEPIHPMTSSHRMNVKRLPVGLYFVKIGDRVEKFVKMRYR